ncbi:hypothetical protein L4C36_23205, partial [Photobacterium japonica]|uniref:hypothetical protein n=1 Tax=Photobacterium japonica TaxID=2910235 RepID=UPI003D0DB575
VNPLPQDELFKTWLTDKQRKFHGNYRDLQTIAILCADYQRGKDARLIKDNVKLVSYINEHVEKFWQQDISDKSEVSIENFLNKHGDLSMTEMVNEFKAKVVRAAEHHCGDLQSTSEMLGLSRKALIDIKNRYDV